MRLLEISKKEVYIPCPFVNSKVKDVLYHGTYNMFDRFNRPSQGIYVTPVKSWAREYYGDNIIPIYANVTKIYKPDYKDPVSNNQEIDPFYERDYDLVSANLERWASQGYNCCLFGGESDSMVLFNNIQIVHAITGKRM